jgi:signal transduction histidine kinase
LNPRRNTATLVGHSYEASHQRRRIRRGGWPFVVLVVVMLLPAAFALWFMNEAITTQASAARQRVLEAYRGQLRLVRSRIDAHWRERAAGARWPGSLRTAIPPPDRGRHGGRRDPARRERSRRVPRLQPRRFDGGCSGTGACRGRTCGLTSKETIDRIADRLNDYTTPLAAGERLMFMDRLRKLSPNVALPTQAALRLSIDLLDAERPVPASDALRETSLSDVWALTSADRRAIGLYTTGRLEAMMHDFLHQVTPAGVVFIATPPEVPSNAEAIAAGSWLPGWQVTFDVIDPAAFDDAGRPAVDDVHFSGLGRCRVDCGGRFIGGGVLRRHLEMARVKTDLVAAASHELRTPLASMRVLVDGLLADAHARSREDARVPRADLVGERAPEPLDRELPHVRPPRARQLPFRIRTDESVPRHLVGRERDTRSAAARMRSPGRRGADLPDVRADADALTTALINLLDNALKYTPDDKRILVRARRDGDASVSFDVEDNGIGIPIKEQRRIFRRFYRVDRRLSRETTGVGLGLSIVELIVRAHGGTVSVTSAPGSGSTFALRLPSVERATA